MMQPAQIVFRELDSVPHWNGREGVWQVLGRWDVVLLSREGVEGWVRGAPASRVSHLVRVNETIDPQGWTQYEWTTPGESHPSGNRHHSSRDWAEVQDRITKWASRRFRVVR
jgi:hypothetical protein